MKKLKTLFSQKSFLSTLLLPHRASRSSSSPSSPLRSPPLFFPPSLPTSTYLIPLSGNIIFRNSSNQLQTIPRVEESKTETKTQSKWYRTAFMVVGGVVVGLCWYFDVGWYLEPLVTVNEKENLEIIQQPSLVMEHPYERFSWFYMTYIKIKRFFILAGLFIPLAFVSMIMQVTQDESWRLYWLAYLIKTFEAAGCTFQKFGQWLSMRPDLFSPDVIEALSKLRDRLPAHDMSHTRKIIKEQFKREIEDIFERFDETPIASGSVAQVHHARLREEYAINGKVRDVAVKVRHPNVVEECFVDVDYIFSFVNGLGARFIGMALPFRKTEFLAVMQRQIDFNWEAYNITKFTQNFRKEIAEGYLKFPSVSSSLLSPAVIVESWANGHTVAEIFSDFGEGIGKMADSVGANIKEQFSGLSDAIIIKKKALAKTVFDMTIKMFLRDNMVHGDLHAGNLLYAEQGNFLTVLDMGLTCSLPADIASPFGRFLHAVCIGDPDKLTENLLLFNAGKIDVDKVAFRDDLKNVLAEFVGPNNRAPDGTPIVLGDVMGQICFALNRHHVELRGDVAVNLMTMGITEGLIRSLDPEFDVVKAALPYFVKYRGWKQAVLPGEVVQNYKDYSLRMRADKFHSAANFNFSPFT